MVAYCELEEERVPIRQAPSRVVLRRESNSLYPIHFVVAFILAIFFLTVN